MICIIVDNKKENKIVTLYFSVSRYINSKIISNGVWELSFL